MKISDILVNHLLKHKTLALPGLGTFTLNESVYVLPDDDKKFILPPGAISFKLNKNTPEDPDLIAEIASITGKIKPLASSDLESVVLQGNQLLNISKPFTIDGLGTLQKNHRNEVEFIPLKDEQQRVDSDRRLEEPGEAIHFGENYLKPEKSSEGKSRILTIALILIIGLGIIGWVGYYFYNRITVSENTSINTQSQAVATLDTVAVAPVQLSDSSLLAPKDSVVRAANLTGNYSADTSFIVIVENAKKERALKRYADLREWGHKVKMDTRDSVNFRIYFPIKAPLSDSARYRDSLSNFFGKKVWIEKQ